MAKSFATFEPRWVPRAQGVSHSASVPPPAARTSMFLRRDLSEEALRQPADPLFTQADLAASRQDGFDAGHAAGMAAAAASREAARTAAEIQALGIIAAAMADARKEAAHVADQAAAAMARTVIGAMDRVMPDLIARSGLNEVGAMLGHVLPGLSREPAVRVEVPAAIAGSIAASLGTLPAELRDRISVTGLDSLRAGEARVHWASGQAVRQPAEIWHAVMQALHPALGPAEPAQPVPEPAQPATPDLEDPALNSPELNFPQLGRRELKDSKNGD
jgi:hypothetical protein